MKIRIVSFACMLVMALSTQALAQNLLTRVNKKHSLELAYYEVKADKNEGFQQLKEKTFAALKKQPGLVAIHSYQDISKPHQYVDVVIWETLENAQKAEQKFVSLPEFGPYNASLEKVLLYSHGSFVKNGEIIKSDISDDSIMEFVAYTIKDDQFDNYESARVGVFDALSGKFSGLQSARTWRSVEQPKMVIDVIFWDKIETARKAFQESSAMAEFEPFNKAIEQIKFFGDYKKVY